MRDFQFIILTFTFLHFNCYLLVLIVFEQGGRMQDGRCEKEITWLSGDVTSSA